ncbi:hypothetical protein L3Q82_022560 [Scortum barcoo]|uniref:Uncharacterized protein n=1 Tax=Scortum barcoo TaxID=214431 RepID=A0ACB8X1P0_9TELE|nr:hypothetical protein L3Q82_022560 [Scortum barcoo]
MLTKLLRSGAAGGRGTCERRDSAAFRDKRGYRNSGHYFMWTVCMRAQRRKEVTSKAELQTGVSKLSVTVKSIVSSSFHHCKGRFRRGNDSVVASVIFYGIVCWASSITDRDRRRNGQTASPDALRRSGALFTHGAAGCAHFNVSSVSLERSSTPGPGPPRLDSAPHRASGSGSGVTTGALTAGRRNSDAPAPHHAKVERRQESVRTFPGDLFFFSFLLLSSLQSRRAALWGPPEREVEAQTGSLGLSAVCADLSSARFKALVWFSSPE